MSSRKQSEQPAQPQPEQNNNQAQQTADKSHQKQPSSQQYFDQPQTTPVQYVVMAESLKGVKGWLMFFTICFVLQGFGAIGIFFGSMTEPTSTASIVSMIFAPLIAASAISAVVLISLGKKLGKLASIASIGIGTIFSIIMSVVSFISPMAHPSDSSYYSSGGDVESTPILIMNIIITLLVGGLLSLYFINSRRVKETLVN